jgi:antitoxin component of RelBE/YafQ-DinJ toxin-antitoxin module
MNAKISTTFLLKTAKINSKGQMPIYLRITVDGKRFEVSTNKYIEKSKWSTEMKRIKGNSEEARSVNEHLNLLISKVFETQKQLILENKEITFETLRNRITNKDENNKTIIGVFKLHNERLEKLVGIEYSYNTLKNFKTTLSHFEK